MHTICIFSLSFEKHTCTNVLIFSLSYMYIDARGRRGHDRMVVGFTIQLSKQSVPITTTLVSSNSAHD